MEFLVVNITVRRINSLGVLDLLWIVCQFLDFVRTEYDRFFEKIIRSYKKTC